MNTLFKLLFVIHGTIHLLAFFKAIGFSALNEIKKPISQPVGIIWLLAGLLFIVSFFLMLLNSNLWGYAGLSAIIISQILIFNFWDDAKYGTAPNAFLLIFILLFYFRW